MPAYCLIRLLVGGLALDIATAVVSISLFLFSLSHSIQTQGLLRSGSLLVVAFAIALSMEYVGSAHSFLFGNYDYTDRLGPKAFGQVPIIIPIAWFMMLYPAWCTATLLTKHITTRLPHLPSSIAHVAQVFIAALAMTAWDLSLDPRMVADGAWVWFDGGEYFGIPLSNFLGWIITSMLIFTVWKAIDVLVHSGYTHTPEPMTTTHIRMTAHATLPIAAYIIQWLAESVANALFWSGPLVALCVFAGMGLFAVPAAHSLIRRMRV
jgi:uncharacterized membrane protein